MTDYKPGTVAVATAYGTGGVRVFRVEGSHPWRSANTAYTDDEVTDVRPLVVLDLDYIRFERYGMPQILHLMRTDHRLAPMADQIEEQAKPPRIPEPGIGGRVYDSNSRKFTRFSSGGQSTLGDWVGEDGLICHWDRIKDPQLIRPGV